MYYCAFEWHNDTHVPATYFIQSNEKRVFGRQAFAVCGRHLNRAMAKMLDEHLSVTVRKVVK